MSIDRMEEQRIWQNAAPKVKRGLLAIMNDVTVKDGQSIYNKTGEDVSHLVSVGLTTTDRQVRALDSSDELSRHAIENGKYILVFFEQLKTIESRFSTELTRQDIARVLYLSTFISWESGRLQTDNGKQHYTKKELGALVDMSTKRFNEFYKRIQAEDIVQEDAKTGEIFVNPTMFYRGEIRNLDVDVSGYDHARLYKKTVRDLYAEFKGRRLGQLSVIYSVLPFLNFNTNIVSYNPNETSEDLIKPIDLKRLSTLLGYKDAATLKRTLNVIKVDGKPVFGFFENPHDRRQLRIVVNPRVVFAGNGESLTVIKALFN